MAAKKKPIETELVFESNIDRDDEKWLYLIDRRGSIQRMERGVARAKTETLFANVIQREKGWMYFLDPEGNVVRSPDNSRDG